MKKAVLLALLLVGCQTTEERLASEDATCRSYGAKPGSSDYLQCRLMKDQQHSADVARRQAAAQKALSDIHFDAPNPAIGWNNPPRSSRCVTRQVGIEIITDCN